MIAPPRMLAAALLGLVPTGASAQDELTQDQFFRLFHAQQAPIQDVAFAFEGEQKGLDSDEEAAKRYSHRFQGRYALRADGATYMEHYREQGDETKPSHIIQAILDNECESAQIWPGYFDNPKSPVRKIGGGPGSLFRADSPETFQFLWRYQSLKQPGDFGYEFLGWEEVDGHRCAHIVFDAHPEIEKPTRYELWVDLERGAHPLRIKNSHGKNTVYVIDDIRLGEFTLASGEQIWFPVGGRHSKYYSEGEYSNKPLGTTDIYVLSGTLRFNQGLGDGVFHVKADRFEPAFTPPPAPNAGAAKTAPGTDFETAEAALDRQLADPDRSPLPDATLATRSENSRAASTGWLIGLGGGALLIGALFARRRLSAA